MTISKMTTLLLAGAMTFSTFVVRAETTSIPLEAQKLKVAQLKERFEDLKLRQTQIEGYSAAMARAVKKEGSWRVVLKNGEGAVNWGKLMLVPTASARLAMSLRPEAQVSRVGRNPMNVMIGIGVLTITGGFAMQAGSQYFITQSDAARDEALRDIETVKAGMEIDKTVIATLSQELGARITNSIISFEGVPEALKVFGGQSLNLNELK